MVNQAEQPENIDSVPTVDTGGTTTDITSDFEGTDTFEDTGVVDTPVTDTPVVDAPVTDTAEPNVNTPVVEAAPVTDTQQPPSQLDELQRRINDNEAQLAQYQQSQYQAQLQQRTEQLTQHFEQQGYLPDQAQQLSQQQVTQENYALKMQQENQQYLQYIQGQSAAAEHFASKYELGMNDLSMLRQYDNPQSMEAAAKDIKVRKDLEAENARLKAERVPPQNFDNSQSSPAASTDEDRWLERYNQGDRSSQAQSAARRAAGLG